MGTRSHFLDDNELDWSKPEATELHDLLVRAYGGPQGARLILAKSGVDKHAINFAQAPRDFWLQALETSARAGRLRALVTNARNDPGIAGYHVKLDRLLGAAPAPNEARVDGAIQWSGKELITGKQETFLDMSFLHEAIGAAASVVRLMTTHRDGKSYFGTGFVIAKDTILTNHHVLHEQSGQPVSQVEIWFNYELDASRKPLAVDDYPGDVTTIVGEAGHDWAIIRSRKPFKSSYLPMSLRPSKPVREGDFVFIVQHPKGQPKKIGLLHNEVVRVTADRVQYLTDTLPGSSGSPVCNEHWEVVALHHRGVEGDGEPGLPRKNEGIFIDRVVDGLVSRGVLSAVAQR